MTFKVTNKLFLYMLVTTNASSVVLHSFQPYGQLLFLEFGFNGIFFGLPILSHSMLFAEKDIILAAMAFPN